MITTDPVGQTSSQGIISNSQEILGKEDFLKLLITQMTNQDPMNPMTSEQFASQLAQFSSVEQLQNINSNLENAMEIDILLNQAMNNTMATTLIGKNVRAISDVTALNEDGNADISYRLDSPADKVIVEIKDINGIPIKTIELSGQAAGEHSYQWDGKDDNGFQHAKGNFFISVIATDSNGASVNAQTYLVGIINSVRYDRGNAVLRIGNLDVQLADVVEIGINEQTSE